MPFMPASVTKSVTKMSTLSRTKIAEFFTILNGSKVTPNTVKKLCDVLEFPKDRPIPLNEVQRIYLLGCLKELINGGRCTYREAMLTAKISRTDKAENLMQSWNFIEEMGGLSYNGFKESMLDFYVKIQD